MGDIMKCKQCGKHMSKFRLSAGICADCKQSNYDFWEQLANEEDSS